MCYILILSLKLTNPDIKIFCGLFTDLSLNIDNNLLRFLKKNCTVIIDKKFNVSGIDNYFLRQYTCWYFSHIYDLTQKYDNVIYTDIDVVFLKKFNFYLNDNQVLIEEMPQIVKNEELTYNSEKIFFNWIDIITKSNKFIYEMNYNNNDVQEKTEFYYTLNILNSNLKQIKNNFGAIYPVKKLNDDSICFHYDNFDQRGYYYKLKSHKYFKKFDIFAKKYFSRNYLNNYWESKFNNTEIQIKTL